MGEPTKTCYTAIIGPYEELKAPSVITPGWNYICYTDQPLQSNVWTIVKVERGYDPQRTARRIKILFTEYTGADHCFWVDAAFWINVNLDDWWAKYHKGGLSAPLHPWRNCIHDEIMACIVGKRGDWAQLEAQRLEYKDHPKGAGIIASGLLMRTRTDETVDLCNKWWLEMERRSVRDQIAFARVSLGNPVVNMYQYDYRIGKEFEYWHHYSRR